MSSDSEDVPLSDEELQTECIDDDSSREIMTENVIKKGPWTSAEDAILIDYVNKHGEGNWNAVQKHSGLSRCGKSCRLRWANHLRPNLKKGAFSADEEQLIIELHAKMGNKWARMAAHLPGRTDNEIKNYWNTRIKRRHRAGLPLYPQEACLQALMESQNEDPSRMNIMANVYHNSNSYDITDDTLHSMTASQSALSSYFPEYTYMPSDNVLLEGIGSTRKTNFTSSPQPKRFYGSRSRAPVSDVFVKSELASLEPVPEGPMVNQSLGLYFPYDCDPSDRLWSLSDTQDSHSYINGNFSTAKPAYEAMKLELPSFQYADTDSSIWDASLSASPLPDPFDSDIQAGTPNEAVPVPFECSSSRNSGLLDALLYEAKAISHVKNQSSNKSSNSSAVTPNEFTGEVGPKFCETVIGNNSEPVSPLCSATSIYSGNLFADAHGIPINIQQNEDTYNGWKLKSEPVDNVSNIVEENSQAMPDLLELGLPVYSDWLEQESGFTINQDAATETLLGYDWATNINYMGSMLPN